MKIGETISGLIVNISYDAGGVKIKNKNSYEVKIAMSRWKY